jgi:hypothetical protein
MPNNDYSVKTINCSHCQQTMVVHVLLPSSGTPFAGVFETRDGGYSTGQEVCCPRCGKPSPVPEGTPQIIGEPFLLTGLEAEIMKQMEKDEGHATVDHLTHVLKVPRADIDAALHKLKVQGHLREGELFGRDRAS